MSETKATKKSEENAPLDCPTRRRFPPLLRRAWYGLNQAFRRRLAPLDLTPDQFTIMRLLTETDPEGLTQRELATRMTSDPNTISALLKRMEAQELVERQEAPNDRRALMICLKPKGKETYLKARELALILQSEIVKAIPDERRDQFLEDLEALAEACKKV